MKLTRRLFIWILSGLAGLSAGPLAASEATPAITLAEWVTRLYEREVVRQNTRGQGNDRDRYLALFTPALRQLIESPMSSTSRMPDGPILNSFFGWGVLPGHPVELTTVKPTRGRGSSEAVQVDYVLRQAPRRLTIQAIRAGEAWQIEDIVYDNGESLASFHRRRTGR